MEYYDLDAVHYSLLSALASSPRKAKAMLDGKKATSSGFELGSLVDFLLTSEESLISTYYIVENKPSDGLLAWADEYLKLTKNFFTHNFETLPEQVNTYILQARSNVNYDSRLKDSTAITKFIKECLPYVIEVESTINDGKIIVDKDTLSLAQELVSDAYTEFSTSSFLRKENFSEYFTQLELSGTLYEELFKAKPDIVAIDRIHQVVYIIDVKTYSDNFLSNFWKFHYYLQTPLYGELFKSSYPEFKDFHFEYLNLAIDTSRSTKPEIFKLSPDLVQWVLGLSVEEDSKYRKIPTIPKLVKALKFHMDSDTWDHRMDYYSSGYTLIE